MTQQTRGQRILAELSALGSLAGPIIIAQLSYTAMGFVDAVMAGRVSARDLAAVALGNSIWLPVLLLMTGTLLATSPKVARQYGAGQLERIGPLVRQALWLALVIGWGGALVLWNAEPVLRHMNVDPELIGMTMGYLEGVGWGFPAVALYYVLRCFSDGQGRTRPSMVFGLLGLAVNIPANYIFIYGKFGLPAMGGVGCGWATTVVLWLQLLGMLAWVAWSPIYRATGLFLRFDRPRWKPIRGLLAVGLPIGISVFAETSIFAVIALLIGSLGPDIIAGHQIALNFSAMIFMIPYSIGMATTVRIGQALGRGKPRDARFCAGVAMASALAYAGVAASLMLLLRDEIAMIYTREAGVLVVASTLLVYSALFQFSDVIQVTAAGALRGYQDTRATMLITLFSYWGIGLPVGYLLGMTDWFGPASGPNGLWEGLIVGLTCAALMLGIRLVGSARRHIHPAGARLLPS